jgi:hypothetical protein
VRQAFEVEALGKVGIEAWIEVDMDVVVFKLDLQDFVVVRLLSVHEEQLPGKFPSTIDLSINLKSLAEGLVGFPVSFLAF